VSPHRKRLDNVLISTEWETIFPLINLKKNPRIMPDHNPLILRSDVGELEKQKNYVLLG
jgi:hypothetical protein